MLCYCEPQEKDGYTYVQFLGTVMGICAWTPLEIFAVSLGLVNILCWLFAQAPQIYKNWKLKQTEALSPHFLVIWLTGDITNLIGCVLTQQLPVQLYTAIYFCFIDVIMVSQWVYYTKINPIDKSRTSTIAPLIQTHEIGPKYLFIYFLVVINLLSFPGLFKTLYTVEDPSISPHRQLLQFLNQTGTHCEFKPFILPWLKIFGDVCAWISAVIYNLARIPQIHLNYRRKTVRGLSVTMFILINIANICYGTYMLLLTKEFKEKFFISDLPYVLGSLGAIVTNTVVLGQWCYYDHYLPRRDDDEIQIE